jgi:hypothetical protein
MLRRVLYIDSLKEKLKTQNVRTIYRKYRFEASIGSECELQHGFVSSIMHKMLLQYTSFSKNIEILSQ